MKSQYKDSSRAEARAKKRIKSRLYEIGEHVEGMEILGPPQFPTPRREVREAVYLVDFTACGHTGKVRHANIAERIRRREKNITAPEIMALSLGKCPMCAKEAQREYKAEQRAKNPEAIAAGKTEGQEGKELRLAREKMEWLYRTIKLMPAFTGWKKLGTDPLPRNAA